MVGSSIWDYVWSCYISTFMSHGPMFSHVTSIRNRSDVNPSRVVFVVQLQTQPRDLLRLGIFQPNMLGVKPHFRFPVEQIESDWHPKLYRIRIMKKDRITISSDTSTIQGWDFKDWWFLTTLTSLTAHDERKRLFWEIDATVLVSSSRNSSKFAQTIQYGQVGIYSGTTQDGQVGIASYWKCTQVRILQEKKLMNPSHIIEISPFSWGWSHNPCILIYNHMYSSIPYHHPQTPFFVRCTVPKLRWSLMLEKQTDE